MAMRSIWMLFLIVMFPFQVAGWTKNQDAMDLAIGIHYHATSVNAQSPPVVVIHTIKWLADNLGLEKTKTSMAIVDFRDNVNVLLTLNDGISATKVKEACKKIGQGSYGTAKTVSMLDVAKETRDKIDWSTDPLRSHLPRVVLVFWEVGEDFYQHRNHPHHDKRRSDLMVEARKAKHVGAGFVFVNHFNGSGWPNDGNDWTDLWAFFPIIGGNQYWISSHQIGGWNDQAFDSAKAIRQSVGMCLHTWNPQHDCYMHIVHGCVQNITIDLKVNDGTRDIPISDDHKWFCFKTATIYPCAGKCPETTTKSTTVTTRKTTTTTRKGVSPVTTGPARISTSIRARSTTSASGAFETTQEEQPTTTEEEPASSNSAIGTDDGDSSNVAVGVGIACGLVILIAVFITVFLVIKCKKKKGAGGDKSKSKSKKATSAKKSAPFPSRSQSLGPAEWSYAKPPELSQTPPSILVKQYMTKKK